jgi:hypothetical protein
MVTRDGCDKAWGRLLFQRAEEEYLFAIMDLLLWTFVDRQIMKSDYTQHKLIAAYKKKVILTEQGNSSGVTTRIWNYLEGYEFP